MNAPIKVPAPSDLAAIDDGLAFLARAAARYELVRFGEMSVAEALVDLQPRTCDVCECSPCETPTFCAECRRADARAEKPSEKTARLKRLMADDISIERAYEEMLRNRPTPQVTVEAILYTVRERGVAALKEPANLERLSRCDAAAKEQINKRIDALKAKGAVR